MATAGTKSRLMQEFKDLQKEKWLNIELKDESIFRWFVSIVVTNPDSYYTGGYFKSEITFPNDYPFSPPTFKFLRPMFHPNIYPDGKVCISILHAPGEDAMSGESAAERWNPMHGVESVLRSILILLDEPEPSSPANVDAGVMYRKDRAAYIKRAKADVEKSRTDIPQGFELPTAIEDAPPAKFEDDANFWDESDAEDDFGGSDSSGEDAEQEFDEDDEGDQEFEDSEDDAKDEETMDRDA